MGAALEEYFEGRQAFFGLAFVRDRLVREMTLPRAKRALASWDNASRLKERDPCPWELWVLMAKWLLEQIPTEKTPDLHFEAAVAGFMQYDLYLRPTEVAQLHTLAAVRPARQARACCRAWGVTLHPWADEASGLARHFLTDILAAVYENARRRK